MAKVYVSVEYSVADPVISRLWKGLEKILPMC